MEGSDKRILKRLFRILSVLHDPHRQRHGPIGMPIHKAGKRDIVACNDFLDDIVVGFGQQCIACEKETVH